MAESSDYEEESALFAAPQPTYTNQRPLDPDQDPDNDQTNSYQHQDKPPVPPRSRAPPPGKTDNAVPVLDEVLGEVHARALDEVGFGRLQWIMMVVLGLGLMGDGIELLMMAYILPGAEYDLCMNGPKKGWLGASAFAGMMAGALLWGNLADKMGRKLTLVTSLSFNAFFAIIGAFMPGYVPFLICRLLAGVGIGGSIPIAMAYFGEFCPRARRGLHLGFMLTFWALGGIYVSVLGWLIVPHKELLQLRAGPEWSLHGWRVFMLVCVIPVLLAVCGMCLLPESPRFLLQVGRDMDALAVYRKLYEWNHSEPEADYEVSANTYIKMPEIELPSRAVVRDSPTQTLSYGARCGVALETFWNSLLELFVHPLTLTTFVLAALWFSIAFGYYGLSIWFPEYMKKLQQEVYFAKTNLTSNTSIENTTFTSLLDNVHYYNTTFSKVTFEDVELRHVTFDTCVIQECLFNNVTAKKSYFIRSGIVNTMFNHTNMFSYRFVESSQVNTSFENMATGCDVDFDVSYSSSRVFMENFLSQLSVLPASLLSAVLLDKIGRVRLLATCLLVSAASLFAVWFTDTEIAVVCINALFNCLINGAFNAIDVASMELYPTHLRSTAFGFLSCLGRIAAILGNVAFGNLIGISKAIPILLIAVILSLGAMCSLKLPESKNKNL